MVIIVRHAFLFCHAHVAVPHSEEEQTAIIISLGGTNSRVVYLPLLQVLQASAGGKGVLLAVEA